MLICVHTHVQHSVNTFYVFLLGFMFSTKASFGQENLRKAEKSFRDWSVFISKEEPKMCFIASQSIKGEAFRNNQKLSSVNREKGTLYIVKIIICFQN